MRRIAPVLYLALVALALVAGCSNPPASEAHPAAAMINELLQLRLDDVRDVDAYTPYFLEPELAEALADGSGVETGTPRVPEWDAPYVSAETTSEADVVVVWKASDDFPDWPAVNIFKTQKSDGRWVVIDALEATAAPEPLLPEAD